MKYNGGAGIVLLKAKSGATGLCSKIAKRGLKATILLLPP
jgi:hypothetical protein